MSTETERQIQALLAEHIGAWSAQTRDDLTAKLAAREAAARREALLGAERALWGEDAEDDATYERLCAIPRERTPFYILTIRALAEPERDEEGGR